MKKKKSERLENGYCPVEKTMIIQEMPCPSTDPKIFCAWQQMLFNFWSGSKIWTGKNILQNQPLSFDATW